MPVQANARSPFTLSCDFYENLPVTWQNVQLSNVVFLLQSVIDERFCFIAEWYDPNAALVRNYQFFYYPSDATTEMVRVKIE